MAEDENRQDPTSPSRDARFSKLDERLRSAQAEEAVRTGTDRKPADRNEQLGSRVLSYLIGGLGGGAVIGWVLDQWFGTSPFFLLLLMFLGTAAGFRSIIRISSKRPD
ncbi:AtpZ/AtpI family protein [Allosphingosinicella deserti]|uniref:ATP synthase protein I n=1 Tax=Allosphingosinicella deserti TaxID=2116704 RepID=A0A2P7QEF5_9SPHN|nr:AtpZ/AtpI family protein [Sphingomonas deserti]PSJ36362.1 F0F1 ATP synthase assembly protein I [Sphingomonas deserti]